MPILAPLPKGSDMTEIMLATALLYWQDNESGSEGGAADMFDEAGDPVTNKYVVDLHHRVHTAVATGDADAAYLVWRDRIAERSGRPTTVEVQ